jgi:acetyl-CoA carboxylase biotin carboxyl carrier protein
MSQPKDKTTNGGGDQPPVDINNIKALVELMVENDLSKVELREGDRHILLRRGQSAPVMTAAPAPAPPPPPTASAPAPAEAAPTRPEAPPSDEVVIRAPMVGTFYTAPDPESPPFVSIGSEITADTVVCIVEAMKVFNEIKAEVSGQITRLLVKNAEAVEFDQPLFAVRPS